MKYSYPLHGSWNSQSQSNVSLILLLGVMLLTWPAAATTYNWTGNSATSGRWGDSGNWSPTGTPGNGDSVSFAQVISTHWPFPTNDISGLTLNQIVLSTNYTPIGNPFTVTGAIYCTNVVGTAFVSNSIILGAGGVTLVVSNAANLELCGQISGSGNLTKVGTGTLTYQYNGGDNINSGTTYVYQGLAQVNVSGAEAFGGPLVIANGSGTAATVQYLQSYEISTVPITVNGAGVLDLHGFNDLVGPNLTLNDAATIQTGAGILYLTSGTTVTYNAGAFSSATISGKLDASSGACTFNATSSGLFSGDLVITAVISDSATIHKTGSGYLLLDSMNTYTGLMSVEGGTLVANNTQALGLSSAGVVVTNNATLALWVPSDVTEPLALGSTAVNGALEDLSTNIWGGPITLFGNTIIDVNSGCILSISNAITGTGSVMEIGGGVLEYVGNHQNTYTGTTYVSQSTLILSNTAESGFAIPGPLVVNTNSVVVDGASYQIDDPFDAVTLYDSSQFFVDPWANEWIGPLTMQGASILSYGTLFLGGGLITVIEDTNAISEISGTASLWTLGPTIITNTGGPYFWADLYISASLSGETGNSGIIKTGTGSLGLGGVNTFGGSIVVSNGTLSLVGSGSVVDSTNAGVVVNTNAYLQLLGNVNIGAVPLTLAGTVYAMVTNSWAGNITLVGNSPFFGVSSGVLTLSGIISGTGGCTVEGPGNVWFSGPNDNTYTGQTFVEEGTLVLNVGGVQAYGGPLVIGDGTYSPTVRLAQFEELNQSQPLTIIGGTLDLNSHLDYMPANMTLSDATIESETAFLYFNVNTVVTNSGTTYISGNIGLQGNCTFNNGSYLDIQASVSGAGGLFFTGDNGMFSTSVLASSNSYSGPTVAAGGALWLETPYSLGTTASSAVVSNNTSLILNFQGGVTNKALVLNGQGVTPGVGNLYNYGAQTNYWTGPITVNGNCVVSMGDTNTEMHLSGPISGPGGIEVSSNFAGNVRLYLDGTPTNSYTGATIVDAGTVLLLNKATLFTAVPGPLVVSGTVRQLYYAQQALGQPLSIYDGGVFDLNGFYAYCGQLNGTPASAIWLSGGTQLFADYLSPAGGTCAFNGVISGSGSLVHLGAGMLSLSNTNTYTGGTTINVGALQVNGYVLSGLMTVQNSTFLCGTGHVGNVVCSGGVISPGGGTNAPGYGAGTLTVSNLTMNGSSVFNADLYGPAPGNYDQLVVLGTNNLGGASLSLNPAFIKPVHVGDSMMLISNVPAGPLVGSFLGVTAGVPLYDEGYQLVPSYTGGSGNDFTLTESAVPGGALPGQVIGGNGNQGIDSDECNELSFGVTNTGPLNMTGVSAVLSSTTPDVVVTQPYSTYPDILSGAAGTNNDWFEVSTLPQFQAGSTINLLLTVTSSTGSFVIPFAVVSGTASPFSNRYDMNTPLAIPSGGTANSSLTVSGFGGTVEKVVVSMDATFPDDGALTNISLMAPNGATVLLSAANGGAGANYGTNTADASRTTFADGAATPITSGTAPFVGTFAPQSPLAALVGAMANGTWHLLIGNALTNLSTGTLQAWSLYLYPQLAIDGGGTCGSCLATITNNITGSDPVETGEIKPAGGTSAYGAPKAWPGNFFGSYHYKVFTFTNTLATDAAVTVLVNAGCDVEAVAYVPSFTPSNISSNYAGDAGYYTIGGVANFSFDAPAGSQFQIVVNEYTVNAGCSQYTLQLDGLPCPPPILSIRPASTNTVQLTWPAWAGGFNLENAPIVTGPGWVGNTNQPVVTQGLFSVTNGAASTNLFFRLHKP